MDYSSRRKDRQSNYTSTDTSTASSYSFSPLFTIPTSSQIHSFSTTPCCTHLYCGTSDGFIRRYALHPTLNGNGIDNPSINNLTMKQGGHEKPPGTDLRTPVLSGYWENEEMGEWTNELLGKEKDKEGIQEKENKVRWGTKNSAMHSQSSVYSLAVHSQELWGLSGTSKGSINLFTIRQDEGQIRHVFPSVPPSSSTSTSTSPSTSSGHSSKSPVSVLTLDSSETSFLSGGWDGRIFDWDLNTGQTKRSFLSHGPNRQISSISYRPISPPSPPTHDPLAGDSPLSSTSSSSNNGIAKTLVPSTTSMNGANGVSVNGGGSDVDADGEMELDADADGEIDDTLPSTTASTTAPSATTDPAISVPLIGAEGSGGEVSRDCFVSTSLDGLVLVWDKRVGEGEKGVVRKYEDFELPKGMGTGKEGKMRGKDRWTTSACWSPSGDQIHVSRHSSSFSTYDLRTSSPLATYTLPTSTGPITQIKSMPNGEHVLTASWDCVRLWDLEKAQPISSPELEGKGRSWGGKGVEVVGGHYGGTVSTLHIDPLAKWMFTTSGNRGWEGASTENLVIHEIKSE